MANPLKGKGGGDVDRPLIILHTFEDKLAFAHHHNFDYKWGRGERWHYVEPKTDDHPERLAILTGPLAEDVWKVYDGKRLDHKDWDAARLNGLERKCRWYIERGTMPRNPRLEAAE